MQLNVWTGTKWVNIFDGNDFKNMNIDLHRVAKVVEDQVLEIDKAVKGANAAMDQANKAVDSSNVNKTAIDDVSKAVDEVKQSASDALDKIKNLASDSTVQEIQKSLKETTDDVAKLKDDQAQHLKDVTGQINDAVAKAKAAADSLTAKTEELQTAVKNAQSDATVATQTASEANVTAIDAKSDAAVATATAKQVTVDMTNVKSDVVAIKATASEATITAGNAASDAASAKITASGAAVTATNAQSDVAQIKATADNLTTRMTSVEGKATANATAIDQNAKSLALKANQTSVDDLGKTVSENTAQLKIQAGQLSSKAESTELKKVSDKADSAIAGNAKAESDAQAASSKADTAIANDAATSAKVDKVSDKADSAVAATVKNATAIDQNSKLLALKADQTSVDKLNKTVTDNSAAVKILSGEMMSKVDSTTVNKLIDGKGFATTEQAQALIDQTANKISGTITDLKMTVDKNGNLISSTNDKLTNVTQTLDGLQTTVKNKADQSQVTQLSNQLLAKVSTKDYQTEIAALEKNLNLRVQKGDVISQINLEAGGPGLIQVANGKGKLLLDADSVIFKSKAFIPSAAIIDIAADKITSGTLDAGNIRVINLTADNIHGGTLDVGNMHVKNFSANDIKTGTLRGINLVAGDDEDQFSIKGSTITWHSKATNSNGDPAVAQIGADKFLDFDPANHSHAYRTLFEFISNDDILIGTNIASYDKNRDEIDMETYGQGPNITISTPHKAPIYDELQGITLSSGDTNMSVMSSLNGLQSQIEFNTKNRIDFNLHPLADGDVNGSTFNIQKDNCVGAYFGKGNKGDEVWITAIGGMYVNNPLMADSLNVKGYKHAIVKTSQGYVGINAYETAEYYFGDIGEANTGNTGEVIIGIDKIFNETVNTKIQYQVFITPYSDCHIWVERRYDNRFVVRSDQPNAKFGWELKAKRKGYESDRLRHIDGIKEKEEMQL